MDIKIYTEQLLRDISILQKRQQQIEAGLNRQLTWDEQVILTYEVSIGRIVSCLSKLEGKEKRNYANRCQEYLMYGTQVDLSRQHMMIRRDAVRVCSTPKVLQNLGLFDLDMYITQKHLNNSMKAQTMSNSHAHNLTREDVKRVAEEMENPVIVAKSLSKEEGWIVILGYTNKKGDPIMVSIEPEGTASVHGNIYQSNFITSVYPRENCLEYVKRLKEQGKLLYEDKKRSRELALVPLQLRQGHLVPTSDNRIRQDDQIVNGKNKETEGILDVPKFGTKHNKVVKKVK